MFTFYNFIIIIGEYRIEKWQLKKLQRNTIHMAAKRKISMLIRSYDEWSRSLFLLFIHKCPLKSLFRRVHRIFVKVYFK